MHSFSSIFENWQSELLQLVWSGGSSISGAHPSREESGDRLEAKVDRQLFEQGIDPAEFDYREEEAVQR